MNNRLPSDKPFLVTIWGFTAIYFLLIVALLVADASFVTFADLGNALADPNIRESIWLTFWTCWVTTILSVIVAVPAGYVLSRFKFPGKRWCDAIFDIPIVLPPLVIGLSLLILFNRVEMFGRSIENWIGPLFGGITYEVPAIVLAQFTVSCAFAVRTMRNTFDGINPRPEQVALTLGCNRSQAFWTVALPQAGKGVLTAGTLAWARALGEFGPVLVFAGATRGSTEVLATTVFLEISIGNLEGAVAVSFLMVTAAILVLVLVRLVGNRRAMW